MSPNPLVLLALVPLAVLVVLPMVADGIHRERRRRAAAHAAAIRTMIHALAAMRPALVSASAALSELGETLSTITSRKETP